MSLSIHTYPWTTTDARDLLAQRDALLEALENFVAAASTNGALQGLAWELEQGRAAIAAAKGAKYALRHKGTHEFVSKLPHDFLKENFVPGWTHPCMLTWDTKEDAEKARAGDPDGASLAVEEVQL